MAVAPLPSRGLPRPDLAPHAPLLPEPDSWALTARAAVGWIALESTACRRSRELLPFPGPDLPIHGPRV